jgi:hypothetical protein
MTILQNGQFTKWPVYKMISLQNDQSMKCLIDEISSCWNDPLLKWPVRETICGQNDSLTELQVDKMIWHHKYQEKKQEASRREPLPKG